MARPGLGIPTGALANRNDLDEYMLQPNTTKGRGAPNMLIFQLMNPQSFPNTAETVVQAEESRRIRDTNKNTAAAQANGGSQPTYACSGLASDPFCDPELQIQVSSNNQNSQTVQKAADSGLQQLNDVKQTDTQGANSSQNLSTDLNTGGTANYNPTALAQSTTGVNALVQELYDTIQFAYYDMENPNRERTRWAQGALMMIYDEMKFNDTNPNTVVAADTNSVQVPMK